MSDDSARSDNLVYNYINTHFAPEDAVLKAARAEGDRRFAGMQVTATEGKILHTLIKLTQAKRILEVGTFMGYSAIWMARALPKDGKIITLEGNPDHAAQAEQFFKDAELDSMIECRTGFAVPSLKALRDENPEPFDLVFIDASKIEYMDYLQLSESMLKKGGLMIGDNTLLFGALSGYNPDKKISPTARLIMQEFNESIADKYRYDGVMIPTEQGLTIGMKRF